MFDRQTLTVGTTQRTNGAVNTGQPAYGAPTLAHMSGLKFETFFSALAFESLKVPPGWLAMVTYFPDYFQQVAREFEILELTFNCFEELRPWRSSSGRPPYKTNH